MADTTLTIRVDDTALAAAASAIASLAQVEAEKPVPRIAYIEGLMDAAAEVTNVLLRTQQQKEPA